MAKKSEPDQPILHADETFSLQDIPARSLVDMLFDIFESTVRDPVAWTDPETERILTALETCADAIRISRNAWGVVNGLRPENARERAKQRARLHVVNGNPRTPRREREPPDTAPCGADLE